MIYLMDGRTCAKTFESPVYIQTRKTIYTYCTPTFSSNMLTRLPYKLGLWKRKTKFQTLAPALPSKRFWLQLQPSKIAWAPAPQPWHKVSLNATNNEASR